MRKTDNQKLFIDKNVALIEKQPQQLDPWVSSLIGAFGNKTVTEGDYHQYLLEKYLPEDHR